MNDNDTSWALVPYEGSAPFKRFRVRDESHIARILRHLRAREYVALLGPPYSEKTRLLHDVADALYETGVFQPVYVNLWQARSDNEAEFFTSVVRLMSKVPNARLAAAPVVVPNARAFQNYLSGCLKQQDHHVALLIDHLQALPHDLVHGLLLALRSTYIEREIGSSCQLVAVVTGGMNLAVLSTGPTSPFNIAHPVVTLPLTKKQSWALAKATVEAYGTRASDGALQQILEWVGGEYYLLPLICAWSAEAVQGYRRPLVTRTVVDRAVQRLWLTDEGQVPIREAIQIIEEDPDSLLDVLRVLDQGELQRKRARQEITSTGTDRLQLCGALVLADGRYRIKNQTYQRLLSRHFTPARVGHVLRMNGRWHEAIDYLAPRLTAEPLQTERADLVEAIVQSIYAADALDEAYNALVRGLQLGFGLSDVRVYRAKPTRRELHLVCPAPDECSAPAVIGLDDLDSVEARTFEYRDYALRRSADEVRLVAALVPEQRPIGVVTVERYSSDTDTRGPSDELLELLRFLRHAAGAIENVTLRAAFQEIGRAVLSAGTVRPTLERVLQAVSGALGCDVAAIYLMDRSGAWLEMEAGVGPVWRPQWQAMARFKRSGSHPAVRCLDQQQPIPTRGSDDRLDRLIVDRFGLHNYLRIFLPLLAGRSTLGTLEVGYHTGRKAGLSEEDWHNLAAFADQVAIAVHNMQLLRRTDEALARRVEEMEKLREVSLAVSSTLDLNAVLTVILQHVRTLFPATEATIWEYHGAVQELTVLQTSLDDAAYRARRLDLNSVTGQAVTERWSQAITDIRSHEDVQIQVEAARLGLHGMIAMPLISRGRILGTINVYTLEKHEFTVAEKRLLAGFAAQAALAIDNAQQYQALETAQRELEDLRERELSDFANALLHRLGNAVGDIPYHLGRARKMLAGDDSIEESLSHVEQRIDSLVDLLEPMKQLIALDSVTMERVDLCQVVMDAVVRALPCQAVKPVLDFPVAPVWVEGNRALLCDAVQSVVENACEALEGKETVIVRVAQPDERHVEIHVTDEGCGISEHIRSRVFEPGFSTKATSGRGRGKGLFTCRAVLRKHRGKIDLDSEAGRGTTFVITLPAMPPSAD